MTDIGKINLFNAFNDGLLQDIFPFDKYADEYIKNLIKKDIDEQKE